MKNPYAQSDADEIGMILDVTLKPGTEDEFLRVMKYGTPKSRAEAGNLAFDVLKVQGRDNTYLFVERWANQAALDSHMAQEHTQTIFAMLTQSLTYSLAEVADHIRFTQDAFAQH